MPCQDLGILHNWFHFIITKFCEFSIILTWKIRKLECQEVKKHTQDFTASAELGSKPTSDSKVHGFSKAPCWYSLLPQVCDYVLCVYVCASSGSTKKSLSKKWHLSSSFCLFRWLVCLQSRFEGKTDKKSV